MLSYLSKVLISHERTLKNIMRINHESHRLYETSLKFPYCRGLIHQTRSDGRDKSCPCKEELGVCTSNISEISNPLVGNGHDRSLQSK